MPGKYTDFWTKEKSLNLIEAYKQRPLLWDSTDPEYLNRKMKRQAFQELADEAACPRIMVERQIKCLRTYFETMHEVYTSVQPQHTAYNRVLDMNASQRWFAYEALKFILKTHDQPTPFKSPDVGRTDGELLVTDAVHDMTEDTKTSEGDSRQDDVNDKLWTVQRTLHLIREYEKKPVLWDPSQEGYNDPSLRKQAYQEIADRIGYPRKIIEQHVKRLRTRFGDRHKLYVSREKLGIPIGRIWFGYEPLKFIIKGRADLQYYDGESKIDARSAAYRTSWPWPQRSKNANEAREEKRVRKRRTTTSMYHRHNDDNDICISHTESSDSGDNDTEEERKKKRRTRTTAKKKRRATADTIDHQDDTPKMRNDENKTIHDISAQAYAEKLKRMDPIQAIYADKLINEILMHGQLNNLCRHSKVEASLVISSCCSEPDTTTMPIF